MVETTRKVELERPVEVLSGGSDNRDTVLSIASADGQTLLLLESDKERA
jgi:hypothetical protein